MPCRDYYDDHPEEYYGVQLQDKDKEIEKLKKQVSFAESSLCGLLTAFEKYLKICCSDSKPYDHIDYAAAGITKKDLVKWHKKHRELDAKYRAEEQARIEKARKDEEERQSAERRRANALAKLTAEDKAILGIRV